MYGDHPGNDRWTPRWMGVTIVDSVDDPPGDWRWPFRPWLTLLWKVGDQSLDVTIFWRMPPLNPLPGWHKIWTAPKLSLHHGSQHLLTPRMCLTLFLLTPLFMDSQDSINATLVNRYLVFPILTSWLSSKTFPPPHTLLFQLQPIKFYWFICIAWSDTQTQVLIELSIKYSISVNTFNPSLPIIERQELPALHKIRFGAFFRIQYTQALVSNYPRPLWVTFFKESIVT